MKSIFTTVQMRKPKRNKFNLSHEKKISCFMGDLIPIFWKEILPSDNFRVQSEIFVRLAPMLAPIMHRVNATVHYFFVPYRLCWNEWEDFITGGPDGDAAPEMPWVDTNANPDYFGTKHTLADYFGLPVIGMSAHGAPTRNFYPSVLPFRAYQQIWNQWYRDQNHTADNDMDISSGEVTGAEIGKTFSIRKRCWEKDYFTSALPWPQRGTEMLLPIQPRVDTGFYTDGSQDPDMQGAVQLSSTGQVLFDHRSGVGLETGYLQGSNAEATINDLRTAMAIQKWMEKAARGGARYIEQIAAQFGVISSDARLQIPEYLGGSRTEIRISEVLSTVEATEPQGNMAGHGMAATRTNGFSKSFEEHGIVIGLLSFLPKTAYAQGIDRAWMRDDKFDYAWPDLAHLGEQEIKREEIYYDNTAAGGEGTTWGYQSRYAEWKSSLDTVHGDFRDELDYWHMARLFETWPELNQGFVESDPTQRIFAVTDEEISKLYVQVYNKVDALRPLPYFGTPSF